MVSNRSICGRLHQSNRQRWVESLRQQGLAPSTVNVSLAAIRKLALEAADNRAFPPQVAEAIKRVRGAKQAGVRTGNWLTLQQAEALVNAPELNIRS